MPISIGGVAKQDLFDKVETMRTVSPYAKRMVKRKRLSRHCRRRRRRCRSRSRRKILALPIVRPSPTCSTPIGWRSGDAANLDGWQVELNPAETGPQLAIQYTGQPQNEFLWIGIERIPGSGGRPYVFYLEHNDEDMYSLDAHWTYPYALWRLDYLVAFRLRKLS